MSTELNDPFLRLSPQLHNVSTTVYQRNAFSGWTLTWSSLTQIIRECVKFNVSLSLRTCSTTINRWILKVSDKITPVNPHNHDLGYLTASIGSTLTRRSGSETLDSTGSLDFCLWCNTTHNYLPWPAFFAEKCLPASTCSPIHMGHSHIGELAFHD